MLYESPHTVTGKSIAHFFSNFSVAPLGEGGQFWVPLPQGATKKFEKKCARLLPVTVETYLFVTWGKYFAPSRVKNDPRCAMHKDKF